MLLLPAVHNLSDSLRTVKHFVYEMPSEPDSQLLRQLIQRILDEAPFSMRQLAEEAGISYDAIRSWAADRRTPRLENLAHLADALERRGTRLHKIADDVRGMTGSS